MKIMVDEGSRTVRFDGIDKKLWDHINDLANKDYNGKPLNKPRRLEDVLGDILHAGVERGDLWMAPD